MLKSTGARLSAALLGYFMLVILLLTLNPFYLAWPKRVAFTFQSDLANLIANIFLFLPLGFLYRLTTQRRGAFAFGFGFSLSIESLQLFIPARTSSVIDILANTLGAGLGAMLHDLLIARISLTPGLVGQLRLETPLMGLIYLLLSLLWANVLAAEGSSLRWLLTLLIGLCGAVIFNDIFRHGWQTVSRPTRFFVPIIVGVWFLLGVGAELRQPVPILLMLIGLMLFTVLLVFLPQRTADRRFERTTLRRILPAFALYLLLLALWPPLRPWTSWHMTLGFTDRIAETSMQILTPRIEYLMAFTVLGYLLAEWRGRSEMPYRKDLPRIFLFSACISLALELLVGFQSGSGASLIRILMVIVGALFGGAMYHLLRAHIRFLLGR